MRKFLFSLLIFMAVPSFAVWDKTLPLGSEAKSLGDDRIREMKTDIEDALNHEGDFPGPDTSSPRFIYTPSTGTTSGRPTGSTNTVAGMLFVNTSSACIETYNGSTWNCIDTITSSGVTSVKISTTIAGDGLGGGGGSALSVQVDTNTINISSDYLTVVKKSLFLASHAASQTDITGDGTVYTVQFTEVADRAGEFNGVSTFTATVGGYYDFGACVEYGGHVAGSVEHIELRLVTSNRTYSVLDRPLTSGGDTEQICLYQLADMDAGDTARIDFIGTGGAKGVDIVTFLGGNGTFFSGSYEP